MHVCMYAFHWFHIRQTLPSSIPSLFHTLPLPLPSLFQTLPSSIPSLFHTLPLPSPPSSIPSLFHTLPLPSPLFSISPFSSSLCSLHRAIIMLSWLYQLSSQSN